MRSRREIVNAILPYRRIVGSANNHFFSILGRVARVESAVYTSEASIEGQFLPKLRK